MFNELPPKFKPGERTAYSNAGFILLGLIIEGASGISFRQYVRENIIAPLGLTRTGFHYINDLPGNTAVGYTNAEARGGSVANTLFMPIVGGSDGGLFTCADDMEKLWNGIFACKVFSANMLKKFLTPHGEFGLGVYVREKEGRRVYYTVGGDFGTDFFSVYFPEKKITATALGNSEVNTYPLLERLTELNI